MKAIVQKTYGRPEDLCLSDVPVPEPATGQVRVRVLACGVNLSDWEFLIGAPLYARLAGGVWRPKVPVLGSDIVGIVEEIGPGVTGFSTGQRVMGDFVMTRGGFAQYACVAGEDLAHVPETLSDEIAACLPQAGGIALCGTDGLRPGDRFLINGAGGGSGTLALQLARIAGAHVTAVDNGDKLDWLRALGADEVMDYRAEDFSRSGQRWDRILDMVATRAPARIAPVLAPQGQYRAVGGQVPILLSLLIGGMIYRFQRKAIGMLMVPTGRDLTTRVAQMAADGLIVPQLDAVLPLSAVPDALRRTGYGEVKGKLVIRP